MPTRSPRRPQGRLAEPTDDLVTTQHTLTVKRRKLHYTATTGRIVLREEVLTDGEFDGHQPKAEVFVTAYTLDGADPANRPVTFAFNGGPGLVERVAAPRAARPAPGASSGDAGELAPPPYGLVDNAETLLAAQRPGVHRPGVDRLLAGGRRARSPATTTASRRDLESVGEVIRLWTSRNGRWMSPKFLAGESYGTHARRRARRSTCRRRYGMYLNGVDADLGGARLRHARVQRRATTCRTRCSCRRTRRSRTTTACTATGRSPRCSPRPRSSRRATTRGRWPGQPAARGRARRGGRPGWPR